MDSLNMRNLWLYSSQRLKQELVFVKKNVKGCTSVMFSKESRGNNTLIGKINGKKFVIDLFSKPSELNHKDFEDIVQVLNNNN